MMASCYSTQVSSSSEIAVFLVMPPQKGLLDGFPTGLMALESHLKRVCEETVCEIADLSRADHRRGEL